MTCQPNPLSVPPLSKNGLIIKFQDSLTVVMGEGKLGFSPEHNSCQIARKIKTPIKGRII